MFITEKNPEATAEQQGTKRGTDKSSPQAKKARLNNEEDSGSEDSDSSDDSEEEITPTKTKQQQQHEGKKGSSKENDFEIVPAEDNSKFGLWIKWAVSSPGRPGTATCCTVFLRKTLYSHSASVHPGV